MSKFDEGWQVRSLGELCEYARGLTYKKKDEVPASSTTVLRANNITLETGLLNFDELKHIDESISVPKSKLVRKGSLLVCSASGSKKHLGKTAFIEQDYGYAFGGFMGMITPSEELDPRYLYWRTRSKDYFDFIDGLSDGANINNLKFSQLSNFSIPYPPLLQQKQIVSLLDQACHAIDKAIANTERNLANAHELFESYLNQAYSGIEERRKFGDVCGFVRGPFGGSLKKSCFVDEGVAVYEQQHAIHKDFENIRYFIDEDKFSEMSRFEVFSGDLLMSCSGTIGKVAIVPQGSMKGIINQALLKLSPNEELDGRYLKYWMESENFLSEISRHSQGAAMKNIASVKVLKQIDVPTPQLEVQNQVIARLDELSEAIAQIVESNRKKVAALNELKQSILQKAFRGKLTGEVAEGFSAA